MLEEARLVVVVAAVELLQLLLVLLLLLQLLVLMLRLLQLLVVAFVLVLLLVETYRLDSHCDVVTIGQTQFASDIIHCRNLIPSATTTKPDVQRMEANEDLKLDGNRTAAGRKATGLKACPE